MQYTILGLWFIMYGHQANTWNSDKLQIVIKNKDVREMQFKCLTLILHETFQYFIPAVVNVHHSSSLSRINIAQMSSIEVIFKYFAALLLILFLYENHMYV